LVAITNKTEKNINFQVEKIKNVMALPSAVIIPNANGT